MLGWDGDLVDPIHRYSQDNHTPTRVLSKVEGAAVQASGVECLLQTVHDFRRRNTGATLAQERKAGACRDMMGFQEQWKQKCKSPTNVYRFCDYGYAQFVETLAMHRGMEENERLNPRIRWRKRMDQRAYSNRNLRFRSTRNCPLVLSL